MVDIKELPSSPECSNTDQKSLESSCSETKPFRNMDDTSDDSDRELQLAFEKGYIKPGLNVVKTVVKRKWINNVSGLKAKLSDLQNELDWIERMDVTVARPADDTENAASENDFKREISFIKQAQEAVSVALPMLRKLNVPTKRPDDYLAEMFKSDEHMKKIRGKLLNMQLTKEKSEAARRLREEKKFASRIQKDAALEKQKEKRVLSEAVKKHKKGVKDQLEKIIGGDRTGDKKGRKRALKDQKFGHGGQKKRAKRNTAESAADFSSFDSSKFSKLSKSGSERFSGKRSKGKSVPKKNQRPGKNRRKNIRNKKKNRNA